MALTLTPLSTVFQPGPQPGGRPTPGGYGAVPQSHKGGGTMGVIMPIYTIGIVVFFVYTILKVGSGGSASICSLCGGRNIPS